MAARQVMLCRLIPLVGVASTGLIYAGLLAAARATTWLRATFRARVGDEARLGLPPIHAPSSIIVEGQVAPRVLPLVFLLVWLYLLVVGARG